MSKVGFNKFIVKLYSGEFPYHGYGDQNLFEFITDIHNNLRPSSKQKQNI